MFAYSLVQLESKLKSPISIALVKGLNASKANCIYFYLNSTLFKLSKCAVAIAKGCSFICVSHKSKYLSILLGKPSTLNMQGHLLTIITP